MTIHSQGLPSQLSAQPQQTPSQAEILSQLLGGLQPDEINQPGRRPIDATLGGAPNNLLIEAMGLSRDNAQSTDLLRNEIEGRNPGRIAPRREQGPMTSAEPENKGFFSFLTDMFKPLSQALGSDDREDINAGRGF